MQIATGLTGWIWEVLRLCGRFTLRASEIDWGQLLFSHVDREFARRSDQLFRERRVSTLRQHKTSNASITMFNLVG